MMLPEIFLLPLGTVGKEVLEWLKVPLRERFGGVPVILPSSPLPRQALNLQRNQYNSRVILNWLNIQGYPFPLLSLVDKDLYSPGLNFCFGEAELGGRRAVISLARLHPGYYSLPPDTKLLRERTLKEAIHELGHLFGLQHCPDQFCVMHFSHTLSDTDRKASLFCDRCQRKLGASVQRGN